MDIGMELIKALVRRRDLAEIRADVYLLSTLEDVMAMASNGRSWSGECWYNCGDKKHGSNTDARKLPSHDGDSSRRVKATDEVEATR